MKTQQIIIKTISLLLIIPIFVSAATGPGIKPNSIFYFLDTGLENIVLFFTSNSENKAKKALEYADERLAEIEASTEDKNSGAIKTATIDYESKIALATEKSKEIKDKGQEENLLNLIADNTSRNQEVLSAVLIKVPEEAKQAIAQAIESSRKSQEEATRQIAELKSEVEQLKKEVAELKTKDEIQTQTIEELNKQKSENVPAPINSSASPTIETIQILKPAASQLQVEEKKTTNITTLPNGAVVEMDANGNVLRYIKEAPVSVPQPSSNIQSSANSSQAQIEIKSVKVTPSFGSVSFEWETNIPTNAKVFVSGSNISTIASQSNSGISTRHVSMVSSLPANAASYTFEIEAISGTLVSKYAGSFKTISQAKIEVGFARNDGGPIPATGWGWNNKEIYAQVYGDNGERLRNFQINVVTPDESQNRTLNVIGGSNQYGISDAAWIVYYPKSAGNHTITFSVPSYDIIKSISFEATPYIRILPRFTFDVDPITSISQNDTLKEIAKIKISSPDPNDEYRVRDITYRIISDTLTDQDIKLSLWDGTNKLDLNIDPNNSFSLAIAKEGSRVINIKVDNVTKAGKFKLSINARFFSVYELENNTNKEIFITNLPLITPEIEVK